MLVVRNIEVLSVVRISVIDCVILINDFDRPCGANHKVCRYSNNLKVNKNCYS